MQAFPTSTEAAIRPQETSAFISSLQILVVEDDEGVRRALVCILRRANHKVSCAVDGEEGWSTLLTGHFDGMITDNDMPRLCGLDLLRRVRAIPSTMPVILISGSIPFEAPDLHVLLKPGLALAKPFSGEVLLGHVSRIFARSSTLSMNCIGVG